MHNLDQLVDRLGLVDPAVRELVKHEATSYAIELAVHKISAADDLTEADQAQLEQFSRASTFDLEEFEQFFQKPDRQAVLEECLVEGVSLVIEAAVK